MSENIKQLKIPALRCQLLGYHIYYMTVIKFRLIDK